MADQKTFVVTLSIGDAKTMTVRIKASSFRVPTAEGGSYVSFVIGRVAQLDFAQYGKITKTTKVALYVLRDEGGLSR
jgi:hypothetical protein